MKFILTIDSDNAAFEGNPADEVARILRDVVVKLELGTERGTCTDYNGNKVGKFELIDEKGA